MLNFYSRFLQKFKEKFLNIYCLSVCFSVCMSVHLCVCPSVCPSVACLYVSLNLSGCLSIACLYVCKHLPVCLSFFLSDFRLHTVYVSASLCLWVCLSFFLALYASPCIHIYLFRFLSHLNPSNPSSDPLTVRTGARAYAFAIRRFRSRTIT